MLLDFGIARKRATRQLQSSVHIGAASIVRHKDKLYLALQKLIKTSADILHILNVDNLQDSLEATITLPIYLAFNSGGNIFRYENDGNVKTKLHVIHSTEISG